VATVTMPATGTESTHQTLRESEARRAPRAASAVAMWGVARPSLKRGARGAPRSPGLIEIRLRITLETIPINLDNRPGVPPPPVARAASRSFYPGGRLTSIIRTSFSTLIACQAPLRRTASTRYTSIRTFGGGGRRPSGSGIVVVF
jgi:hypothetical protein